MTKEQIDLVRSSFSNIDDPIALTTQFYENLFEINPSLKELFKKDLRVQKKMLADALKYVVDELDNFDKIKADIQKLGARHVNYGVKAEDYGTVGTALVMALESKLGNGFSPEVKNSWLTAYTILADTMINVQ